MSTRYIDSSRHHDSPRPRRPQKKQINIQDGYLFEHLKEGRRLAFVLTTGQQLQGRIERFDRFTVLVDDGKRLSLVYKHAIAGITAGSHS